MIAELYKKYYTELVRWCQGMTGNRQTAEEMVQEAFLRALENSKLFVGMNERQFQTNRGVIIIAAGNRAFQTFFCQKTIKKDDRGKMI